MLRSIQRSLSLSRLIVVDGIRRHALLALVAMCMASEVGALLFFDFIPRDIGRASADFVFSIAWLSGFLFLLFHAIQTVSWREERSVIYSLLARPISRNEYVIGVFWGLIILLFLLNCILASLGWVTLLIIKNKVSTDYFQMLSPGYYVVAWTGLMMIEVIILAVIMLISSLIRGGFIVLLLTVSYYFICSGLPVAKEAVLQGVVEGPKSILVTFFKIGTFIFPDFAKLDFKNFITEINPVVQPGSIALSFLVAISYICLVMFLACLVYSRRDLK